MPFVETPIPFNNVGHSTLGLINQKVNSYDDDYQIKSMRAHLQMKKPGFLDDIGTSPYRVTPILNNSPTQIMPLLHNGR